MRFSMVSRSRILCPAILCSVALLLTVLVPTVRAADWPLWSGPHHNLSTTMDGHLDRDDLGLELLWQRPFGPAYATISVSGQRLVTAYSDGVSDLLVALDVATGEELWRFRLGDTHRGHDASDDGVVATPTIHHDLVYGLTPTGWLVALRLADGSKVWSRQLVEELKALEPFWGFNSSPTVIDDVLVMQTGGPDQHAISGLDPATGELRWAVGDDPVFYQSPTVWQRGDGNQVVALTNTLLLGLRPDDGTVLWQTEHGVQEGAYLGYQQVVPLSDGRFLLTGWIESRLLQVQQDPAGDYQVEQRWQSRALTLRGGMAVPAVAGSSHLYGFAGPFLACLDAATGEAVWRSRSPGQGNLVLADQSLVILTNKGEVVVAAADPGGYHERARIKAMDDASVMRPIVAADRIFVRSSSQIAAVGLTTAAPGQAVAAVEAPRYEPRGEVGQLLAAIDAADDKGQLISRLLSEHPERPIIEGDDLVHFVVKAEADELMLTGSWMGFGEQVPMIRLSGTDLWVCSVRLAPGGVYLYSFAELDQLMADPGNSRHPAFEHDGTLSLFTTPGFQESTDYQEPTGPRGRRDSLTWKSELLGNEREVLLLLPAAYDVDTAARFPLLVILSVGTVEHGKIDVVLDNLTGSRVTPIIVALVKPLSYAELGSEAHTMAAAMATELVPLLESKLRTKAESAARAVMGSQNGGKIAIYAGLKYPDVFAKVAARSFRFGELKEQIINLIEQDSTHPDICLVRSPFDFRAEGGWDSTVDNRELLTLLEKHKITTTVIDVTSGVTGWGDASLQMIWFGWKQSTGSMLETLFPMHPAGASEAGSSEHGKPQAEAGP